MVAFDPVIDDTMADIEALGHFADGQFSGQLEGWRRNGMAQPDPLYHAGSIGLAFGSRLGQSGQPRVGYSPGNNQCLPDDGCIHKPGECPRCRYSEVISAVHTARTGAVLAKALGLLARLRSSIVPVGWSGFV